MGKSQKEITSNICEGESWYMVPSYKVMLVRDSAESVKATGKKSTVKSPEDMAEILRTYLDGADREHFIVAMLDRKGNMLGLNTVSIGGLSSSIAHPREVFKPAIIIGAASIILCHNHPSGDHSPSPEDIEVTRRMIDAGKILGIDVLDHIVMGDPGYCSLKGRGLI
jgi:DNA repair protein RadC